MPQVEVEGVPHAPGRVGRWDVEGAEVVPVGLDLGALRHLEPHAHEDVLQRVPGLGHQVEVAADGGATGRAGDELGEVDPARRPSLATAPRPRSRLCRCSMRASMVDRASCNLFPSSRAGLGLRVRPGAREPGPAATSCRPPRPSPARMSSVESAAAMAARACSTSPSTSRAAVMVTADRRRPRPTCPARAAPAGPSMPGIVGRRAPRPGYGPPVGRRCAGAGAGPRSTARPSRRSR